MIFLVPSILSIRNSFINSLTSSLTVGTKNIKNVESILQLISLYLQLQGSSTILSTTLSYTLPCNCNHKRIGLYYLLSTFLFGISGTILSVLIRLELCSSSNRIIPIENQNFYNLKITLHGLLMIFFLVMPGLFGGLGNTFVPIYLGSSEVAYPRINNMSVLVIPLSYTLVLLSINNEFGSGIGWTLYPPLSTSLMSLSPVGIDVIICGLLLSGISSTLTSLNFFVTIQNMRCYGMTLSNMSVYVWSIIITASMLLLVLPILTGALIMLIADLHYNTVFFDPLFGGDPVFYQHLFWFFGHPEVYILILPAFGLISMILSGLIQVIIFGNQSMILAMSCISILGSVVWSHHMFTVGMESDTRAYFTVVTMMISLPTGSKIFNWLCTYLGTNASLLQIRTSAVFFVLIFLLMFTIGGSTGVILGNGVVDIALHDTYYIVTHFHFILSLGTVIAIFSGIMFFQDQLLSFLGSLSSISSSTSSISRYHLVVTFVGILLTFTPMHFLGFNVMPRRVLDYQDYLNSWNYLCSIGSSITLISFFILGTSYTGIYRHNSMTILIITLLGLGYKIRHKG